MYLRYSSSVVAPIVRNSPRASCGFSMFDASTEPSAAPAPTMVCSSSMNKMICPCESVTSFRNAFSRSSNSPRNFAPAIIEPMSIAISRLFLSDSGTSPEMIRRARPSTIAVLPNARFADQHRIVLRSPGEHLHHAPDFVVASDHRIDLSPPRQLGQIASVLFQGLIFSFRILIRHALRTSHLLKRLHQLVASYSEILQRLRRRTALTG